jgi:hypothetical protein
MKNDAKLGMLAGVLGVIVAAVLFANGPPSGTPGRPGPTSVEPNAKTGSPSAAAPAVSSAAPAASAPVLASTPVGRTRKETDAQPTGRAGGTNEEP